jgi:putative ATP-binding cassette transporter
LLVLNATEVGLLLRLSSWNRDLFDALERRDAQLVLVQVGVLLLLVAAFALLSFAHLHGRRRLALDWRAWLARHLSDSWLAAGRPHGIPNADGRIAEDARIATEEAVELASSFSHGCMTLACFVGLLWVLSDHPPVPLGFLTLSLPGYLVWAAVLYAGLGAAIAALLGRPLALSTHHRQAEEAEYRAALVRLRDGAAEPDPAALLSRLFGAVGEAFGRQSHAFGSLQLFCVGNTRLGTGLPFLIATPAYLAGIVTLGWVMQAAQAFQNVVGALNWPVDHMPRIATWRASAERVLALHAASLAAPLAAAEPAPALLASPAE